MSFKPCEMTSLVSTSGIVAAVSDLAHKLTRPVTRAVWLQASLAPLLRRRRCTRSAGWASDASAGILCELKPECRLQIPAAETVILVETLCVR